MAPLALDGRKVLWAVWLMSNMQSACPGSGALSACWWAGVISHRGAAAESHALPQSRHLLQADNADVASSGATFCWQPRQRDGRRRQVWDRRGAEGRRGWQWWMKTKPTFPSLERRPSVIDERARLEGEETSPTTTLAAGLEKAARRGWEGWISVQVCVFTGIKRETYFIVLITHRHISYLHKRPNKEPSCQASSWINLHDGGVVLARSNLLPLHFHSLYSVNTLAILMIFMELSCANIFPSS